MQSQSAEYLAIAISAETSEQFDHSTTRRSLENRLLGDGKNEEQPTRFCKEGRASMYQTQNVGTDSRQQAETGTYNIKVQVLLQLATKLAITIVVSIVATASLSIKVVQSQSAEYLAIAISAETSEQFDHSTTRGSLLSHR